ncbi:PRC-barrel domain-containing protein [Devosia sp.]|uniref:PRC-barrel domain-containing protein n=1 Tax=Devosia sp. TaxID=1871048 RepID=UPI003265A0F6
MGNQSQSTVFGSGFNPALVNETDRKVSHDLIASDRVEGTRVYALNGDHIGHIERILLEKRSGQVAYAVLGFGGFLGLGNDHYPLPWGKLAYDEELGGYKVDVTREQLDNAPKYDDAEEYYLNGDRGRLIYDYYGVSPYWI